VAKNSAEAYGASGKTNLLNFDPHALHLVDDPAHTFAFNGVYGAERHGAGRA
jgi:hypothetical protein